MLMQALKMKHMYPLVSETCKLIKNKLRNSPNDHGSLLLSEACELNDVDHFEETINWLHFLSYAAGVTV